jgi:hypothetical protein
VRITIRRDVVGSGIEAALPAIYRPLLLPKMFRAKSAHVILFPQQRVVTSSMADRAVKQLGSPNGTPCIAFAHDATSEARECLLAANVQLLTTRDYGWSDARYQAIHGGQPH